MPSGKNQLKALPGAIVMFNHDAFMSVVNRVADYSGHRRADVNVIVVKPGHYRCNSDEVVLYNHLTGDIAKGDLVSVRQCLVSDISSAGKELIGARDVDLVSFLRDYVSDEIHEKSQVTLFQCQNLRGRVINKRIEEKKFQESLRRDSLKE